MNTLTRADVREKPLAIETIYKGYRFRSRLEARWAVYFGRLGLKNWTYELEGYSLRSGYYLPDFFASFCDETLIIEIKPGPMPGPHYAPFIRRDWALAEDLHYSIGAHVVICYGDPLDAIEKNAFMSWGRNIIAEFAKDRRDAAIAAALYARQARFEHGERP